MKSRIPSADRQPGAQCKTGSALRAGSGHCELALWLRITALWLALALGIATATAVAQPDAPAKATAIEAPGTRHALLHWVASSKVFNNVNRDDARAALKVSSDILAQQRGYVQDSTVDILDSVAEIKARLQNHSVELVSLGATDYLELESSKLIVPVLTDSRTRQGAPLYSYVLMVGPTSPTTSLAGLRGNRILVSARGSGETGFAWLEVLLGKEKLGRAASFFASAKTAPKPQACILPLFFGTVDACLVDEVNLNLAKEMNPQLGKLRVLARSRPMIESVIAVPSEPHPFQKELIDTMLSLQDDPRGRQLLMVFKTDRLVPIQPGDLDSARELWRDYYKLTGSTPGR